MDSVEKVIEETQWLVVSIAKKFSRPGGASFLDLVQEGNIALLLSIKKFDPSRNVTFSTYARPLVKKMIKEFAFKNREAISIPYNACRNYAHVRYDVDAYELSSKDYKHTDRMDLFNSLNQKLVNKVFVRLHGLQEQVVKMSLQGMTIDEIRKELGLTRQRIHQVINTIKEIAIGVQNRDFYNNVRYAVRNTP